MTNPYWWLRGVAAALITCAFTPCASMSLDTYVAMERGRPVPPPITRDRFLAEPAVTSVELSPNGRHVAWLRRQGSDTGLWLTATDRIAPRRWLRRVDAERLYWSHDGRWLFLVTPKSLRAIPTDGASGAGILASFDRPQDWRVIGPDPWQPAAMLLLETRHRFGVREPIGTRLWRVRPGGRRTLVAFARRRIVDVAVHPDGHVAFAKLVDGDRHLLTARSDGGRYHVIARCEQLRRCDLLGTDLTGLKLFLRGDLVGDLQAVMEIRGDGRIKRLHEDPAHIADLDMVALDPKNGRPIIAAYRGPVTSLAGLTPEASAALQQLRRVLPGSEHRVQPSSGRLWLIEERDARLQGGRWHLFDSATGRLRSLIDDPGMSPRIAPGNLARVIPVAFRASDGMTIHALLTLPPGRDVAQAPLVVFVHGGPWSSDTTDYSAQTQLLANRGYIVFRPQYRGSTGFGRRYLFAAHSDFGDGRVQRDIEDGTRWLLANRIGDPKRVAIVGASYGGYAVLQALSDGSRLYRVGVAAVPPADFGRTIARMVARGVGGDYQGIDFASRLRALDLDPANPTIMGQLSHEAPVKRIARLSAPLTIIAAERDDRIALRDVLDYAARGRLWGKPIDMIVAKGQPHAPDEILPRRAMLFLTEDALARHLGLHGAEPPIQPVRKWMTANLRRADKGFP
ncbi:alpha/beta fold hydrolase [Sphingomonas sanguinis]|uniref:S9 family peptidase n=1 Tax=Sphingomonas sanguinis TaxID=33051 RepID=UPI001C584D85|nr:alpha/beta fold hydrolase [Sphingomonas sanguinis]QXT35926.1 alpha/beta fold hydrolase [Sphingomonas sanguinis]